MLQSTIIAFCNGTNLIFFLLTELILTLIFVNSYKNFKAMNILKKASLLIPFILMGMLLTSHTTTDSTILTDDDFGIAVVGDGKRGDAASCNEKLLISKDPSAPMPTSINITIWTMVQMNYQFLAEVYINPQQFFANSDVGYYFIPGLYEPFSGVGQVPVIVNMTVNTPTGSSTVDGFRIANPNCP